MRHFATFANGDLVVSCPLSTTTRHPRQNATYTNHPHRGHLCKIDNNERGTVRKIDHCHRAPWCKIDKDEHGTMRNPGLPDVSCTTQYDAMLINTI